MFRIAFASLFLAVPAFAAEPTQQVKLNGHTFTLPQGFEIELVAGPPQVERPIVAAFDEKGRLYVCDSSGSNAKVTEQVKTKPHRIVRLESTKGDGKYDKSTVFVKNVMLPEGAMWMNGSLYVAAPPHIWKFTDTDNDGVADKEEIWFDGKTLTGCANDLHGPYRGPDGDIYWCKGAFAAQEYTVNGKEFRTTASHIFRATPDGKNIEPVMTGGMDNPVDVVFTPGGDIILSTTFLQHPANGKRDGLIHAVYGAVYGKDHAPVHEHPWTSPQLMLPMTDLGPAAPCGLHRYESDQFGKGYANNIFCAQFNMRKVSRHVLIPSGSTYTTKDYDFVVSDNIDFHPTDVIEDADGSLLIIDTGGWYKLCCPTSQLVKPDVTGAIYRVKKVGAHTIDDPRGLKIDWTKLDEAALGKLLHDPRPVVRQRVMDHVSSSQDYMPCDVAIAALTADTTEHGILAAVWLTARDGRSGALDIAGALALDSREEVRLAAMHVLALFARFDDREAPKMVRGLEDKSLRVRRVAAQAIGRTKAHWAIPNILEALADENNDRALDHALTFALIEIARPAPTAEGLKHKSPRVRRAVLAALENMPKAELDAKTVFAELDAKDAALRETAWWIAGRHPQWGDQLAGYFAAKLKAIDALKPAERDELADRLVKFARSDAIQKVLAASLTSDQPAAAKLALHVMSHSGLKRLPVWWRDALLAVAPKLEDREMYKAALAVFRAMPTSAGVYDEFVTAAPRAKLWPTGVVPDEYKLATLAARPTGQKLNVAAIGYLFGKLDREEPASDRAAAADVLLQSKLSDEQLVALSEKLKRVGPLELPKLLGVFARSTDVKVGLALVAALRAKEVRPSVRVEIVKPILDKYSQTVQAEAEKLYAELAEARKDESKKLAKMLAELKTGDIRRGQLVFNSQKTNCIACHKVGYVGGSIGPDLTKIGSIRTERDLLEAIVFPSASFVRSYEPVRVLTTDDRTFNGILKKDAPDEIIIVVAADKEERVARADVASITPSSVSLMPSGLDQQLSPQDLADLIAFLKACK